jgi:hypothetical protein
VEEKNRKKQERIERINLKTQNVNSVKNKNPAKELRNVLRKLLKEITLG